MFHISSLISDKTVTTTQNEHVFVYVLNLFYRLIENIVNTIQYDSLYLR